MSSSSRPARCPPESSARPGFCQQCPMGLWEVLCLGAWSRRSQKTELGAAAPLPSLEPDRSPPPVGHLPPAPALLAFQAQTCLACLLHLLGSRGPAGRPGPPSVEGVAQKAPCSPWAPVLPTPSGCTPPPASFCLAPLTTGRQGVMPRDRRPGHLLHLCEQVLVRDKGCTGGALVAAFHATAWLHGLAYCVSTWVLE